MIIEFYNKKTGLPVPTGDYFILNGDEVWYDNYEYCESQESSVGFDDFTVEAPTIGWRVVSKENEG